MLQSTFPQNLIVIVAHFLAQYFVACSSGGVFLLCVRSCYEIVLPVGRMHFAALTNILALSQII